MMKDQKKRTARMNLQTGGPAGHQPAPHYLAAEFDPDHLFRDLLNQAKDLHPDAFARHYFAAAQQQREDAARHPRPFERERELDELFGELIGHLCELRPPSAPRTAAEEADFIAQIAAYCAALDILQETN